MMIVDFIDEYGILRAVVITNLQPWQLLHQILHPHPGVVAVYGCLGQLHIL